MLRFVRTLRRRMPRADYWLAGQFNRAPHPMSDAALQTWSELLGDAGAKLWMDACKIDGRVK